MIPNTFTWESLHGKNFTLLVGKDEQDSKVTIVVSLVDTETNKRYITHIETQELKSSDAELIR